MRVLSTGWLWLSLGVIAAGILCFRILAPRFTNPNTLATIPDLSVTSPLNQPGGGRCSSGSIRNLFRTLPAAPAGTTGLRRRIANRYPAGERKLSETLDASGTRDVRFFCGRQSTKPSMGEEVHDSSRVFAALPVSNRKGPGLPCGRWKKRSGLWSLSVTASRALSRCSRLRSRSRSSIGVGGEDVRHAVR